MFEESIVVVLVDERMMIGYVFSFSLRQWFLAPALFYFGHDFSFFFLL